MVSTQSKFLLLGDVMPNFQSETQLGAFDFYEYINNSWAILFSHPKDYTPVCTTELGRVAQLASEFEKRKVKVVALSCDSADEHKGWIKDVDSFNNCQVKYPIIGDPERKVATTLGMLQTEGPQDNKGLPLTVRSVFVIGPDKKLKLSITYPASTGRNFDEVLRVIDSLQMTFDKSLATPVDWKQGQDAIILPSVSEEDANKNFVGYKTAQLPSGRKYLRTYKLQ